MMTHSSDPQFGNHCYTGGAQSTVWEPLTAIPMGPDPQFENHCYAGGS